MSVDQPQGVRAKCPDAVCPGQIDDLKVVTGSVAGAGQHNDAMDTFVRCLDNNRAELAGGHRDDREIKPTGYVADRRSSSDASHLESIAAHRHDLAEKAAAQH